MSVALLRHLSLGEELLIIQQHEIAQLLRHSQQILHQQILQITIQVSWN